VKVLARTGEGMDDLKRRLGERLHASCSPLFRFAFSDALRAQLAHVQQACPARFPRTEAFALWALMSIGEGDELELPAALRKAVREVVPDEAAGAALDREVVCARYAWIDEHVGPHVSRPVRHTTTERADAVLIHPVWGFASFLLISLVLFQSLFAWSDPAIGAIEWLFGVLGERLREGLGEGVFADLIIEGVIGGAGSVVVFLPQILLLFFFVGLMEDSGYMARVAYLMDRIMRSMGLHGRAFVPMLSGFACAVPAIMATRTMERQRDRFLTMMVVPLMTCSARLPVYTLIIGSMFPDASWLGIPVQGGLMIAMYLFSVVISLLAAWVRLRTWIDGAREEGALPGPTLGVQTEGVGGVPVPR
jgi:ferrous iron transport protein B